MAILSCWRQIDQLGEEDLRFIAEPAQQPTEDVCTFLRTARAAFYCLLLIAEAKDIKRC